jgi:hypothetical protein
MRTQARSSLVAAQADDTIGAPLCEGLLKKNITCRITAAGMPQDAGLALGFDER